MNEFSFLLNDRIEKIKQLEKEYDLSKSCISFSGGKDSVVLHNLIDLALPGNKIPRFFINTGIEFKAIVDFVKQLQEYDDRIIIINQKSNIKYTLEKYGYPFKSKEHSKKVDQYQRTGIITPYLERYLYNKNSFYKCSDKLSYQFTNSCNLRISSECCNKIKKKPFNDFIKDKGYLYIFTGMRKEEGGQRKSLKCITFNKYYHFNVLVPVSSDWEDLFIKTYDIKLCSLYYPPFNFIRTGCKGCPYNIELNDELLKLKFLLPNEYKQCEILWKNVYDEYRKIGFRLYFNKNQLTIFDL